MNNYIVRSYRDVIVITKFAITKFATRRASKSGKDVYILPQIPLTEGVGQLGP